jgi:ABC-type phosphate transport system substrate-binding protein
MPIHVTTTSPDVTLRGSRPLRTALAALVAVATAAALAGCGGGSADSTSPSAGSSTSISTSSKSTSSNGASSKAPYTDAEACAWLKENLPNLPDTTVGAQAQLVIGLSTFFEQHGGLPGADGYALDGALTRGCADLHAAALKKAGIETFGNL